MSMRQNKYRALSTVIRKVTEIKSCINANRTAFGQNSGTIELLLDSILSGLSEEVATVPKLRLVK